MSSESIFSKNIDAIIYINLEHRTDRKEHILSEIKKICQDTSKIHRIDAVKKDIGAIGCGLSHIKALEYALIHQEWNTILILEDDFTFKSESGIEIQDSINELLTFNLDVGILASCYNYVCSNTSRSSIKKVSYSQTTSGYIIKRSFIHRLVQNFKESVTDMEKNGINGENCIDIHWKHLKSISNWYMIEPCIGYQYGNYSDIEKRHTNYCC